MDFLCFAEFSTENLGKCDEHLAKSDDFEKPQMINKWKKFMIKKWKNSRFFAFLGFQLTWLFLAPIFHFLSFIFSFFYHLFFIFLIISHHFLWLFHGFLMFCSIFDQKMKRMWRTLGKIWWFSRNHRKMIKNDKQMKKMFKKWFKKKFKKMTNNWFWHPSVFCWNILINIAVICLKLWGGKWVTHVAIGKWKDLAFWQLDMCVKIKSKPKHIHRHMSWMLLFWAGHVPENCADLSKKTDVHWCENGHLNGWQAWQLDSAKSQQIYIYKIMSKHNH